MSFERELFVLRLGGEKEVDELDPQVDWTGFLQAVTRAIEQKQYQWNSITSKESFSPY